MFQSGINTINTINCRESVLQRMLPDVVRSPSWLLLCVEQDIVLLQVSGFNIFDGGVFVCQTSS